MAAFVFILWVSPVGSPISEATVLGYRRLKSDRRIY
jgi:hypothetical protein